MKITISGTLGSGKTTIGKMIAEKLKYNYFSTGAIARKISEDKNLPTFLHAMKLAEHDNSIDKQIDDFQTELGRTQNNFVLEGRLGFHFIPDSVKIYLTCDEKVAAERVLKGLHDKEPLRLKEGLKENTEEIIKNFHERRNSENRRYAKLYGIKQDDVKNFDFIIDTTHLSPDEVCTAIMKFIERKNGALPTIHFSL